MQVESADLGLDVMRWLGSCGLFTVMGKIGKGAGLHWVGWLLFWGEER